MSARTLRVAGGIALASGVTLGVASAVLAFAVLGKLLMATASLNPFAVVGLVTGILSVGLLGAGWLAAGQQY